MSANLISTSVWKDATILRKVQRQLYLNSIVFQLPLAQKESCSPPSVDHSYQRRVIHHQEIVAWSSCLRARKRDRHAQWTRFCARTSVTEHRMWTIANINGLITDQSRFAIYHIESEWLESKRLYLGIWKLSPKFRIYDENFLYSRINSVEVSKFVAFYVLVGFSVYYPQMSSRKNCDNKWYQFLKMFQILLLKYYVCMWIYVCFVIMLELSFTITYDCVFVYKLKKIFEY